MHQASAERLRIGRNIRLIRELRNYDQRYVSMKLGISRSTLSTWENGVSGVTIENLGRLAEVFGLRNYSQILGFEPDRIFDEPERNY